MPAAHLRRFVSELRRRKVIRVAIVYGIVAWLSIQVAQATFDPLGLPRWTLTLVIMLAILGFPIAVVMAWALERTPEGIRREKPADAPSAPEALGPGTKPVAAVGPPSIAVLPFS